MATNVTLPGAGGTTVTIPYTTAQIGNLAQAASNGVLSYMAQLGTLFTVESYAGSGPVPSPPLLGMLDVSGSGTASLGVLPTGYLAIANTASTEQVMLSAMTQATTVWSGTGGIVYANFARGNQDYLAGGTNLIAEFGANATSAIYVDSTGTSYTSGSLTAVEALSGSATVTAGTGADVVVYSGTGSNVVNVGGSAGTSDYVAVSNAATVSGTTTAVTVNATGGTLNFGAAGAPALINPNAANVVILPSGSGNITLNAGTGSDTVFAGPTGVFHAGSGGSSILETGMVAGATTLFGGAGGNDQLSAFAPDTMLVAGKGGDLLYAINTPSIKGVTFDGATIQGGVDTIIGSGGGADTVNLFGNDASVITGAANETYTYTTSFGTAADTIAGFNTSSDVFKINGTSVQSTSYVSGNSMVTLNDGTTLAFTNANMTNFKFS